MYQDFLERLYQRSSGSAYFGLDLDPVFETVPTGSVRLRPATVCSRSHAYFYKVNYCRKIRLLGHAVIYVQEVLSNFPTRLNSFTTLNWTRLLDI